MFANIVREVAHRLVNPQQGLARSPFGVNHIMGLELDVKEFEFVMLFSRVERNRRTVDQACGRNQKVVEQQGVTLRHIEIGAGNVGGESRAGNPDRTRHLRPGLALFAPDATKPSNPLNRAGPSEDRRHQVADRKIFDPALTRDRRNPGASQEAVATMRATAVMWPIVTAMSMMSAIVAAMSVMSAVVVAMSVMPTVVVVAPVTGKCRLRRHHLHQDRNRGHRTNGLEVSCQNLAAGSSSCLFGTFNIVNHCSPPLITICY